jgi:hypothetical protein
MKAWPLLFAIGFQACDHAQGQMTFELKSGKSVYLASEPVKLTWRLHNDSTQPWIVLSHYSGSGGKDYDQITLRIDGPGGRRSLASASARTASVLSVCRLLPDKTLENELNLSAWTKEAGYILRPGDYTIRATYEVRPGSLERKARLLPVFDCGNDALKPAGSDPVWEGAVSAPSVSLTIR